MKSGSEIIGIVLMGEGEGKQSMHFLVNKELLPHAIVNINIPINDYLHVGVFYFILFLFISLFFLLFYLFIHQYQ
jgi:hypothetical protein